MSRRCTTLVLVLVFAVAGRADAQNDTSAAGALYDILFGREGEGALSSDLVAAIRVILPSEAATFPLASSAGGFTWTFDPALGVQTRRTQSFGPIFAERPFTNGRKKFNVGVAFQHTAYKSLAGQSLNSLNSVFPSIDAGGTRFVETYASSLSFSTDRTIISASYGVTDRVDIGVLVPIERTTASGSSAYRITLNGRDVAEGQCAAYRYSSAALVLCPFSSTGIEGRSSGLGDVVLRGKVSLASMPMFDLGAGIDLRLPTGDDQQLLGLGRAQTKLMAMGSSTLGNLSPHFNFGYTVGGKGIPFDADGNVTIYDENGKYLLFDENGKFNSAVFQPSDEVNYTFGVDVAATASVTVMGDIVGRSLRHSALIEYVNSGGDQYFTASPSSLNLVLGTIGAKIKIGNEFLFTASVVFPLNSAGIKPGITPVIGFERAF